MTRFRLFIIWAMLLAGVPVFAQEPASDSSAMSDFYSRRYDLLVSKLGYAGVGVETLLDSWAKVEPDSPKLLEARYSYYITKAATTSVVPKYRTKYLGNKPLFTLKDSTGVDIGYFQETTYDDSLFSMALRSIDRAISLYPENLAYSFAKAASLIGYEKESPDMALSFLMKLADDYYSSPDAGWSYAGQDADNDLFTSTMQEYCYTFFNIGSVSSYEAFRALSEKMLEKNPDNVMFMSNLGTYYFIALDEYRTALKYYNRVLKKSPDDYTSIKNCILLSRRQKDVRLEKKYLQMMVKYGPEQESKSARARLEALGK